MMTSIWTARIAEGSQRTQDHRSPFQRDRARILHSEAFRCLQAKTQIHAVGEDDFYRTRLTHSLEVAQIGSSLREKLISDVSGFKAISDDKSLAMDLKELLPSRSLIESLCFAHDIGHPPFGHGGETALNYKMRQHGGFEGNAQSFRIVTQLEPYTAELGMNLTRRTLLGIVKYPAFLDQTRPRELKSIFKKTYINLRDFPTPKGLYREDQRFWDWVIEPLSKVDRQLLGLVVPNETAIKSNNTLYRSLDCSIMELADDIAYGVHDLEDAIVGGMITPQLWQYAEEKFEKCQSEWIKSYLLELRSKLFSTHRYERKDVIGALVNYFITNVQWKLNDGFSEPLLRYNAELPKDVREVLSVLKHFVYKYVICDVKTQRVEYKGQRILMELFDILSSDPTRLLPKIVAERWQNSEEKLRPRVICDYLASMSDGQAFKLYQSL